MEQGCNFRPFAMGLEAGVRDERCEGFARILFVSQAFFIWMRRAFSFGRPMVSIVYRILGLASPGLFPLGCRAAPWVRFCCIRCCRLLPAAG
jgi:hypothetical protein